METGEWVGMSRVERRSAVCGEREGTELYV